MGWNEGFAQAPGLVAAALSDRDGFAVYVAVDGGPAKELIRSTEFVAVGGPESGGFNRAGLSADGSLLCLAHSEHGDLMHPALRVVDPRTGGSRRRAVGRRQEPAAPRRGRRCPAISASP